MEGADKARDLLFRARTRTDDKPATDELVAERLDIVAHIRADQGYSGFSMDFCDFDEGVNAVKKRMRGKGYIATHQIIEEGPLKGYTRMEIIWDASGKIFDSGRAFHDFEDLQSFNISSLLSK